MVRIIDYESRKRDILTKTIEFYLDTAQPVSSEALLEAYGFDLSSATIRNVLKELEESGYLTHPHTSAGRIPTDRGYRFYINDLMYRIELSLSEKDTIERFFNSYLESKMDVLENASKILSNFTHYVGVGNQQESHKIYYNGLSYLLEQPEFKDVETVHSIFKAFDEDKLLDLMNRQMDASVEVIIGGEFESPGMNNCALIIRECSTQEQNFGKIAVLGPKRMAYKRVMPMMDFLSELIIEELE